MSWRVCHHDTHVTLHLSSMSDPPGQSPTSGTSTSPQGHPYRWPSRTTWATRGPVTAYRKAKQALRACGCNWCWGYGRPCKCTIMVRNWARMGWVLEELGPIQPQFGTITAYLKGGWQNRLDLLEEFMHRFYSGPLRVHSGIFKAGLSTMLSGLICTQPMRDGVTLYWHLSLAGCKSRISPVVWTKGVDSNKFRV